jgi:membrane protease subunit (stomatin/prohibitin family)
MVFEFIKGEFIDVISWLDDSRDTMVWRFDRYDQAIKYGAKLTVREGQAAVFIHEGQLADVFGPGLYLLETNNLPVLTTLQHWSHGFSSPFKSEIYFVNTTRFADLKWGTKNPIMARDKEFGPVRIRAFGTYAMRVTDPGKFMTEIVGTDGEFTADEISFQIRNIIVQEFSRVIATCGIPVLDMAANTADLAKLVTSAIAAQIAAYGLSLPEFYIENISLPEEVEKALDKRTSMGIVGDLGRYMQFNAAEGLAQPGSAMGAGMGAAMGAGMGMQMGGMQMGGAPMAGVVVRPDGTLAVGTPGPWGAPAGTGAQVPPPPPAPEPAAAPSSPDTVWHIAEDGTTSGPFSTANMGRKTTDGSLTRDTLVWTPGQDGWKKAGDVAALARLFTVQPPPAPGA